MRPDKQSDLALPVTPLLKQPEDRALMAGEFAGMYQAGFEAGYRSGREAGYQQGFRDGLNSKPEFECQTAAIEDDAQRSHVAVAPFPVEGQPATKHGPLDPDTRKACVPGPPRRMLLGMPCKHCRMYLKSDETHCPCCKEPVKAM